MTRSCPASRKKRRRRKSSVIEWLRTRLRAAWRALRVAPRWAQIVVGVVVVVLSWATANWVFQVIRKPAELFFPVSGALSKTPAETWQRYESIFRKHATATFSQARDGDHHTGLSRGARASRECGQSRRAHLLELVCNLGFVRAVSASVERGGYVSNYQWYIR